LLMFYFKHFSDCFNILRADLHEIRRIGRIKALDKRPEVFFDPSTDVAVVTNFVGKKSTSNPHLVVRMTFARAAPPAFDNKDNR